jgi:hypothetical protein
MFPVVDADLKCSHFFDHLFWLLFDTCLTLFLTLVPALFLTLCLTLVPAVLRPVRTR